MRMGCPCAKPLAGYVLPVMVRGRLQGVPSRGGLRRLGQDSTDYQQEYADAVGNYVAAGGSMTTLPDTSDQGTPAPPWGSGEAVNASGQSMADILAAGESPADLGPTYDTSQTGAAIAPSMQTSWVGSAYGEAADVASGAGSGAGNWCSQNTLYGISYCWWAAGAALAALWLWKKL